MVRLVTIKKIFILLLTAVLLLSMPPSANANITATFQEFTLEGEKFNALTGLEYQAAVRNGVSYWNALTEERVNMPLSFGEFINTTSNTLAFSDGAHAIAFNKHWTFSTQLPTQLITSSDYDMYSITVHEIGHNMGIILKYYDGTNYGQINGGSDSRWGYLIRDTEGNNIDKLWITTDPDNKSETFISKLNRGVRYVFTGQNAADVNGDVWLGDSKAAVPVPVEAGYQTSKTLYEGGSTLVHPYTRFGLMNAINSGTSMRPFFSEVELAVFRDLGVNVDIDGQFGRSIYTNNNTAINNGTFESFNRYGIGLHIVGDYNTIIQNGDLYSNGIAGTSIRVEGIDNKVLIPYGTTITANGIDGKGVLVSHGSGAYLINRGTIEARGQNGTGVYLNSGTWSDDVWTVTNGKAKQFDNSGIILAGTNDAIRLAGSVNNMTINFMNGSQVTGNITADNGSQAILTFGKLSDVYGAATAATDSAAVMIMTGNIVGGNALTMNVLAGKLYYTGTAALDSATVENGAGLFGNSTYTLTRLTNHGTLSPLVSSGVPGSLTINGDLLSDGNLGVAAVYGSAGKITVTGGANVGGSRVVSTTGSLYLPNTSYTILQGGIVTGTVQGGAFTGMLNAVAAADSNKVTVTTAIADNLGTVSAQQQQTFTAMNAMYNASQSSEMAKLYSLNAAAAKQALTEIFGGAQLNQAAFIQSSTSISNAISARLNSVSNNANLQVDFNLLGFASSTNAVKTIIPLEIDVNNGWWMNLSNSWSTIAADGEMSRLDNQNLSVVLGADKKINENWRVGLVFESATNSNSSSLAKTASYGYRMGAYAGYHRNAAEVQTYIAYGNQKNNTSRYMPQLGLQADSNYDSNTLNLGATVRYNLQHGKNKVWQFIPYANANVTWYNQNSYQESGAGVFNQMADSFKNTYSAGEIGIELARKLPKGRLGVTLGYKKVLSGYNPSMLIAFAGNPNSKLTVSGSEQDRDYAVIGINYVGELDKGWTLNTQFNGESSRHSNQFSASLTLRRTW